MTVVDGDELAARLPAHIDYVARVRPGLLGTGPVVEFSRPVMALDFGDVIAIANLVIDIDESE